MILIGQYDSPFVRRVGITLTLYVLPFEHRPWSVFGDGEQVRALNPLMRVPALVLSPDDVLTDSTLILDYLDSLTPTPLAPRQEPDRHRVLRIAGLGAGLAEKAVSLFYERRLHDQPSPLWQARLQTQIRSAATALEAARPDTTHWFGTLTHADIAVACAIRFLTSALPGEVDMATLPRLAAHSAALEATPAFMQIYQAFDAPS